MNIFLEILDFWLENKKHWFKISPSFDELCSRKYKNCFKKLNYSEENPREVLGVIILLDQLSRNIFRGKSSAYKYDNKCLNIVLRNLELINYFEGSDLVFFLMPLKHCEILKIHSLNISLWIDKSMDFKNPKFCRLYERGLKNSLKHYEIIKRFGRYPKRNKILNRECSKKELEYLVENPNGFI